MITKEKIIEAADRAGWNCTIEDIDENKNSRDKYFISFRTDTHYCQDVCYEYEVQDLKDIITCVAILYHGYDVDEEVYLWLDSTGHPKCGAPSSISELVEDMKQKGDSIENLYFELQKLE